MSLIITGFIENQASRRGNSTQSTREYTVEGSDGGVPMTEEQLYNWMISQIDVPGMDIPYSINGYGISDISYGEAEQQTGLYRVSITWDVPLTELGYGFNFQAQGGHFIQSLETISAWGIGAVSVTTQPLNLATAGLPNFGGAINVVPQEDGPPKVEGLDVQPPPEVFKYIYHAYDAVITTEYQQTVYNLCGKVNEVDWNGLDAGTTMLVRANGERHTGGVWTLEFGFGYIPNLAEGSPLIIGNGISFGDTIHVNAKDGMDLLWVYRERVAETDYGLVRPMPKAAYVERVWERADLYDLNLPGIDPPE